MSDIEIRTNLPALKAQLRGIGLDMEQKIMRQATRRAAAVFGRLARKNAPVLARDTKKRKSGFLKKTVRVKRSRDRSSGREHFYITSGAFYWYFLERGWVSRGKGKALRGGRRSKTHQRNTARAQGAKVHRFPFMEPAFEQGKDKALDAFFKRAQQGIAKYNQMRTERKTV